MTTTLLKSWITRGALFSAVFLSSACCHQPADNQFAVIPLPQEMTFEAGHFTLTSDTSIGYAEEELAPAANYLAELLRQATGYPMEVAQGEGSILLSASKTEGVEGAYSLKVSSKQIAITGRGYEGVIAGIQTLRQLLPVEIESREVISGKEWVVPATEVNDAPRYAWRGLMLDVSRHFYDKAEVMELLDLMSLYKMNKFHWHLTDDQGWRIEIKKYPLLTEKGAWRTFNNHDRGCMNTAKEQDNPDYEIPQERLRIEKRDTLYGGFYTQDDIREIVAYATQRGIDIIPEIDIPGHMLAGVSNYKGLSCSDQIGWGKVFSSPLCPGKESALTFCKNVYAELFDLFPYKYVHIGGDEVDKTNWKKCPDCQRRMRQNGLKTEAELQSWFNHQMEEFLNAHGKEMIGWDEIIEGGLSQTSTVMWWRSWSKDAPHRATAHGNKVIYTPNTAFYLDYQQDKNSVKTIYDFETNLEGMTPQQTDLIMGVQGNIWCEWIPSRERLLYMATPRMLAIAELGWSSKERDWANFQQRMIAHFDRLNTMEVNYRIPDLEGFYNRNSFIGEQVVEVSCIDPQAEIRYTTDGSIPTLESTLYTEPIRISETTEFTFRTFGKEGRKGDYVKTTFIKDSYSDATEVEGLEAGLQCAWYDYAGDLCEEITSAKLNGNYTIPTVEIPAEAHGNIGLVITGYINLQKDDIYTFKLTSDDGSILKIDSQMVVDNDGAHAPVQMICQKALKAGYHPIEIQYFDHNGGMLQMQVVDSEGNEISPKELFAH